MAAPMRESALDGGHRTKVADPRTAAATNFEYDDNEWDIGIGDLIIDLDADIEKTNEKAGGPAGGGQMAQAAGKAKMAVEHSATVQDKGLKMKIKRTKPGTKTSEAKHEIVKPGEQNGAEAGSESKGKHPQGPNVTKRLSGGHRKDKAREKHCGDKALTKPSGTAMVEASVNSVSVNGVVRPGVTTATTSTTVNSPTAPSQTAQQPRPVFPASQGPGPPSNPVPNTPGPPSVVPVPKLDPPKLVAATPAPSSTSGSEERSSSVSPPPTKRIKTTTPEAKEMVDVCVGTSVGTITEPDCLGPCEPGTSVTLEGIVWHETEGGVLVVNVTWRGKTYVGTLLDCTRHDWAPPRFCDSPTSDLDARTPKGRGKRGRNSNSTNSTGDLSNFTETRSSVHSKLRNGNAKGGRTGRGNTPASSSSGSNSTGSNSPTPFVPPKQESGKKSRERDTTPTPVSKKNKTPLSAPSSPPASPVLLECPEPNCSKKYKHINGLKYHQSHAHGSADDDDTKDATSFSENEESNTEAPSPSATPVKSPSEKTETPRKEELSQIAPMLSPNSNTCSLIPQDPLALPKTPNPESPSAQQTTPLTPRPLTPNADELMLITSSPVTASGPEGAKNVVKPGVLRFGPPNEEFQSSVFSGNKSVMTPSVIPVPGCVSSSASSSPVPVRTSTVTAAPSVGQVTPISVQNPQGHPSSPATHMQPPVHGCSPHQQAPVQQSQSLTQGSVPQQLPIKLPQFKVKSAASLMPDDKSKERERERSSKLPPGYKKKSRKSPAGSPHPPSEPQFGMDSTGRDDLQSPAYSDISDDAAPVLESEVVDKAKSSGEKKGESSSGSSPHGIPPYGIYGSFYGQPPYLVPSVPPDCKGKENSDKPESKPGEKEIKKEPNRGDYSQKLIQHSSHYYPYGYVPSYPGGYMEPGYPVLVSDDKNKEGGKGDKSPGPTEMTKHGPSPIQVPNPAKVKPEPGLKDGKHANENHQIIKESIEMKNQMSSYLYSRQPPSNQTQQQIQEDLRRYLYPRGKESAPPIEQQKQSAPPTKHPPSNPSPKHKEKAPEEKKEEKVKQEGQKPTMETQGPPPPPTSQYAYIHPSYMQSPHYGALPFDPSHPMYRNINPMLVPGPYGASPYLGIPRYHAPEDLSRSPSGTTKALDLLQHHANQYYSSHKIHELQERALKSPTPSKTPSSRESPSGIPPTRPPSGPSQTTPTSSAGSISGPSPPVKPPQTESKDSRSPPPQRHVHTHHHTHVGLTYPILTGQYPAPYGVVGRLGMK
ncbi:UNVERIFIED_CONTAM: hypothetical protein PYX00_000233 [Menopon gallinae]|uniref:C2H2-type domain-containing protein n=1 Tax=Menopon gallinae TaxID=328185 RepID=A0AAW2I8C2_9NEOP